MQKIICQTCHSECMVDGEYPKFFAWCDSCGDYAKGFDVFDFAADWQASMIDSKELLDKQD